jgi:hypothetical protein
MHRLVLLLCAIAGIAAADVHREVLRSQRVLDVGIHEGVPWPLINARVIATIDAIQRTLVRSRYQPSTRVKPAEGIYDWDCSGMAAWILRRSAPTALQTLHSSRPVARDFVQAIERAPINKPRHGWQRIVQLADVMPGDVFAWRRPRGMPSKNTGHVGFVVDQPQPVREIPGAWAVQIADSTSSYHQNDTRSADPDGGFGIGTLVFLTDETGRATSYGWAGTLSEWYIVTPVVFGRVSR